MIALGRLIPAAFLAAVGLAALRPIDDADFWWLLRAGRYMVETRTFLTTDPFSATAQGAEWLNHAWGFELLIYGLYTLAGTTGVILLQGVTASATFGILYGLLRQEGVGRGWSVGLLSLGALATHGFWSPRPQLVTYFILAIFARVLADYQAGRRNRLWWLPVLTAVWANLHAGFLAGPLLVALCAAGELVGWALGDDTGRAGGLARARVIAFWSAASVAASLANPFHYHAVLFPFQVMGERLSQAWITEWGSPPFGHPQVLVLELILGLVLVLSLGTARPLPWRDLVVLVPLVHLAFQATRNTPLLVIVATPILGRAIASCVGAHWARLPGLGRRALAAGALGLVLASCTLVAGSRQPARVWSAFRPAFGEADTLPAGAVDFLLREGRRGTLWNEYVWGGYLIWHLYPELRVSIDGRMAVYGPVRFREHLTVSELEPGWQDVLAQLDVNAAVVRSGSPLASALRAAGWVVRYEDRVATVLDPPGRAG
jgi:hypothetical protein